MSEQQQEIRTYRGRTLEELVPKIREELGDDAVIVARRETRSGGFAGFFARREIEVDVAAGGAAEVAAPESPAATAFREQLAAAQAMSADWISDEPAGPESAATVHPLPSGRADAGAGPASGAADWNAAGEADVIQLKPGDEPPLPDAQAGAVRYQAELEAALEAELDHDAEPDALLGGAEPVPVVPEPILAEQPEPPEPPAAATTPDPAPAASVTTPEPAATPRFEPPVAEQPPAVAVPPLAEGPLTPVALGLPPTLADVFVASGAPTGSVEIVARRAAQRMADRGLGDELAERAASEAAWGLWPFSPETDVRELVARALASHLPPSPLRAGPARLALVGPSGAGKTRCVARLAAVYSRQGELPVTVVALRPADQGDELRRLLSPYGVALRVCGSGADAAAELATDERRIVLVDTPAIVLRDVEGRDRLAADLRSLALDEVHVAVAATMSLDAAGELLDAAAPLRPTALVVTHCDETFQLGTMIRLSSERDLPISYMGQGQAVDAGLMPGAAEHLAAELLC